MDRRMGLTRRGLSQPKLSRRSFVAGAGGAALAFPMVNFGYYSLSAASPRKYSKRAMDIVGETLVIDMLAPLHMDFSPDANTKPPSEQAIADYKASGITG